MYALRQKKRSKNEQTNDEKDRGNFEPSLLMLVYFEFSVSFPSINAKNSDFSVSQHRSRRMKWVENG
jgi:hypothetical protein